MKNKMFEKCWMSRKRRCHREQQRQAKAENRNNGHGDQDPREEEGGASAAGTDHGHQEKAISMRSDTTFDATVAPGMSSRESSLLYQFWLPSMAPIDSITLPWKKFTAACRPRA